MLGHANLETTEIYTHVSIDKLIAVHRATHPSRLQRHRDAGGAEPHPDRSNAVATILDALAQNDEDAPGAVAADAPKAARR